MTSRERRGGPRVPDGVPRPASLPFVNGPNRTDMAELPGTPGTPLPPNPAEPQLQHGQGGPLRRALKQIPLNSLSARGEGGNLRAGTQNPQEPITAGLDMGPGIGSDGLIPSPQSLGDQLSADEMRYAYPLIMRLASLPNATTETKILAQRLRAKITVPPERMPMLPELSDGVS